jgi:cell division protein FtsB
MLEEIARRYGLVALLVALLLVVLFSENGILDHFKLKRQMDAIDMSTAKLQNENIALKSEIDRLQKDDRYLEDVARKKFGFIKQGEKVYRIEK